MNRLLQGFTDGLWALGFFLVLAGISVFAIALFVPSLLGTIIAIGLMILGAARIASALLSRRGTGFWLKVLAGILYSLAGLVLLTGLFQPYFSVSELLGVLLLLEAGLDLTLAWQLRSGTTRRWLLVAGGAALVCGLLFLVHLELGTAWLIGLVAGLCLVAPGVWFMILARGMKAQSDEP